MKVLLLCTLFFVQCAGSSELVPFEKDGLFGYKNTQGETVIQPQFQEASAFLPAGVALVLDTRWHYIDRNGTSRFTAFLFDNGPDYFVEGRSRIVQNEKVGFMDEQGRIVIDPKYDFAAPFVEGMAAFCKGCREEPTGEHRRMQGGKWGFIDLNGIEVIPAIYESVQPFEKGVAIVSDGTKMLKVDRKGHIVSNEKNKVAP